MCLKNGWTWDVGTGTVCHFRHHPTDDAMRMVEARDRVHAVETVNGTCADGEPETIHHNTYITMGMADAIALATRIEIESQTVVENVVRIRPATESETSIFLSLWEQHMEQPPAAISEREARRLAERGRGSPTQHRPA